MNRLLPYLLMTFFAVFGAACTSNPDYVPKNYKLVYHQTFDDVKTLSDFEFTQPDMWKFSDNGNLTGAMEFSGKSTEYQPPVRSPHTIALLSGQKIGSFILEADLLQTGKEYGHRDMCLFFGFQDSAHFYYIHIASKTDDHAHNIFIVNNEPRTKISTKTNDGIHWGDEQWHKVRLVRDMDSGLIQFYFDNMQTPIMEANDKNFGMGHMGFGSFDDSGIIDNISIWADKSEDAKAGLFSTK